MIADRTSGGRSDDRLVRHCLDIPTATSEVDSLEVTQPARTAVDVARTSRFGEADGGDAVLARGASEYLDERYRNGRTLEQVLLDEKWREQRLRRQPGVRAIARWDYATAASPARLGRLLRGYGLR